MVISDTHLRRAIDTLDSEIAIVEATGTIRYTNQAWANFAIEGAFPGEPSMVGESYLEACRRSRDADEVAALACAGFEDVLAGSVETFSLEYPCPGPDDHDRWFLQWTNRFTADGEPFVVVEHVDITDRKRSENRLAYRTTVLETVASIISHDLRSPLTAARAWAEILDDEGEQRAAKIVSAINRVDEMIDDALILARETAVEDIELVDIDTVARDAWELIDTEAATLETEPVEPVFADSSLLQTMFQNLFLNAVEHGGQAVTVRVGPTAGGFYVEDDGAGIGPEHREGVFDAGYTTRSNTANTGMGLAIVEAAAFSHQWDIALGESDAGGARFEFTVDRPPMDEAAVGTPETVSPPDTGHQ